MSLVKSDPFVLSSSKSCLQDIGSADCSLAVWERPEPLDAGSLLEGDPENLRISVPADCPAPALLQALDTCRFPQGSARQELVKDVVMLCDVFRELTSCPVIEIRLELVTGNSCWKFHCDYVEMRLITTYAGRGTQWLDRRNADRLTRGLDPETIHELRPGDVGLFKGRLGNGDPAIHRSPPIEGTGEQRLLLVLNPVND
ncbi:Protein of unknown function [Parasphingorhabdus marina DSM 22363]|uniref:DUF1826 domain-containing protein n=1 Tax=Parasphingorhabdus marina DSM 22363 TaxID=1123272 RepID=A0A1N6EIC7_9SPHN|nr:DUF1826 domain-containing protein [Parasphingorhabdus marina]SIN82772.1 Protein of unknown function [Parasphingorhabdus marina DSM 22363]